MEPNGGPNDSTTKAIQERQNMMYEVQIKLDQNDRAMKEQTMQKLQAKVKELMTEQRDLRAKLRDFEQEDQSLICKLEEALCFGKIIFLMKPLQRIPLKDIQAQVFKRFCREFEETEHEELRRFSKRRKEQELDNDSVHLVDADSEHHINLELEHRKMLVVQQQYTQAGLLPPP